MSLPRLAALPPASDDYPPHNFTVGSDADPGGKRCSRCGRPYWMTPTARRLGVRIEDGVCLERGLP